MKGRFASVNVGAKTTSVWISRTGAHITISTTGDKGATLFSGDLPTVRQAKALMARPYIPAA